MDTAKIEVLDEQILIHPTCNKDHGKVWTGEARISGKVIINGVEYEFDKVVDVEFEKLREEKGNGND
jgi:hypothetical protein